MNGTGAVFRSAVGLVALALTAPVCFSQDLALQVAVVSREAPAQVVMQEEGAMQRIQFQLNEGDRTYRAQLPWPKGGRKLSQEYRLVATWSDWKEQLFLKLRSQSPSPVLFTLFRNQDAFNDEALSNIERLGSDLDSLLEKYSRARAFHLTWRYEKKLPEYYLALRSARVWFDTAVSLSMRSNAPFGMDSDIKKIMDDYETRAAQDNRFARRYRAYVVSGYVRSMLEHVEAADYFIVANVRKLTREGRFQEAYELNDRALSVLEAEPERVQRLVEKRQGVNLDLLRENKAFLTIREALIYSKPGIMLRSYFALLP